MTQATTGPGAVQSVDRALTILTLLAQHGEFGVTELAARLGIHKSTAFRLVTTLELHGLVEQPSDRGKYRLGVGALQLAGATAARLDLVQAGRQVTRRLSEAVGGIVNLAVLSEEKALYVDQTSGNPRAHDWVGQHAPLHATSDGKVLLAHLPSHRLGGPYASRLPRFTDRTIVDPIRFRAELGGVRAAGYATAVEELQMGLTAVAAPVRGADGRVVASLSASAPSGRLTAGRLPTVSTWIVEAAAQISRRMGWTAAC